MGVQRSFVTRNGLEVDTNLIFADADANRVGVGTTTPASLLDVNGEVKANQVSVASTFSINGKVVINGSEGQIGDYIVRVGNGVTFKSPTDLRTPYTFIAEVNQTTFLADYSPSAGVDVFINGARLSAVDYNATNGSSVVLNVPCFGGEKVDIIAYSLFNTVVSSTDASFTGIVTATGGFISVGNTTPVKISVTGNQLIFTVTGIGSTSFTLA